MSSPPSPEGKAFLDAFWETLKERGRSWSYDTFIDAVENGMRAGIDVARKR